MATEFEVVLKDKKNKQITRQAKAPQDITEEYAKALFIRCNTFPDHEIISITGVEDTAEGESVLETAKKALKQEGSAPAVARKVV